MKPICSRDLKTVISFNVLVGIGAPSPLPLLTPRECFSLQWFFGSSQSHLLLLYNKFSVFYTLWFHHHIPLQPAPEIPSSSSAEGTHPGVSSGPLLGWARCWHFWMACLIAQGRLLLNTQSVLGAHPVLYPFSFLGHVLQALDTGAS